MKGERVRVKRTDSILVQDLESAESPWLRLKGLMLRSELPELGGLWIYPCNNIHMMFMRFPIDVVWLNSKKVILKISSGVAPWYGMAFCWGAGIALELPSGNARDLQVGDELIRE
jgi:uncharacterized protein